MGCTINSVLGSAYASRPGCEADVPEEDDEKVQEAFLTALHLTPFSAASVAFVLRGELEQAVSRIARVMATRLFMPTVYASENLWT